MKAHSFPGCCSAQIIGDFGGTDTSYGRSITIPASTIVKEVTSYGWFRHSGLIVATTNDEQTEAMKALRKLGFKSSVYTEGGNHGKRMKLWYIDAAKLKENIILINRGKK